MKPEYFHHNFLYECNITFIIRTAHTHRINSIRTKNMFRKKKICLWITSQCLEHDLKLSDSVQNTSPKTTNHNSLAKLVNSPRTISFRSILYLFLFDLKKKKLEQKWGKKKFCETFNRKQFPSSFQRIISVVRIAFLTLLHRWIFFSFFLTRSK